jgi:hypothetical protein
MMHITFQKCVSFPSSGVMGRKELAELNPIERASLNIYKWISFQNIVCVKYEYTVDNGKYPNITFVYLIIQDFPP